MFEQGEVICSYLDELIFAERRKLSLKKVYKISLTFNGDVYDLLQNTLFSSCVQKYIWNCPFCSAKCYVSEMMAQNCYSAK